MSHGNYQGNVSGYVGIDFRRGVEARKVSFEGYYKLIFVKSYGKLTDEEMDLRLNYGVSLIAQYMHTNKDFLFTNQVSSEQTATTLDEVYQVKNLKRSLGKLSIRSQYTIFGNQLTFIFRKKQPHPQTKAHRHYQSNSQRLEGARQRHRN